MRPFALRVGWGLVFSVILAVPGTALECRVHDFEGNSYEVCDIDPGEDDLRLFLRDGDGVIGTFQRLVEHVAPRKVHFAMNAGMFHPDRSPVGLYQETGKVISPLVLSEGPGNFGMLPNGVLCITDGSVRIFESRTFNLSNVVCRDATQSGPLLVLEGELHPRLIPNGTSRFVRNGVGADPDGKRATFAISQSPVNFYDFARFFRDGLGFLNALYLDGNVSKFHSSQLGRTDFGLPVGPFVAVIGGANLDGNERER